jgi:hypothetical protein
MNRGRRRPAPAWLLIATLSMPAGVGLQKLARADAPPDAGSAPAPRVPAKPQAAGPTTRPTGASPTTRPKGAAGPTTSKSAKELSAEEMLSQMLKPPQQTGNRPLAPLPQAATGGPDKKSGAGAVAPAAPVVSVLREGSFLVDRVGRLSRSADGSQAEFAFDSDGTALQDPPVVIIPNLKLMQMEDAVTNAIKDPRFRVSGMVTEYRGRNYILLEKVVVVPEILEKF